MNRQRSVHPAVSFSAYLLAIVVPLVLALAVVGSSPALLAMVPEEHRGTVASFGEGAARVSGGDGGLFRPAHADAANSRVPGTAVPLRGEWSPRRAADIQPPAGLIAGVDYAVEATEDGYLAHWPCEHEIPVRSYDAPPGSESDLAWAVETLAFASGLPLRYAGPGAEGEREGDGAISVTYGDHPMFHTDPEIAGLGGVTVWPQGLVLQGSVTLRPDQITPVPGDAWSRSLTLHELMHAVGIDHAGEFRTEIMTSRRIGDTQTILGHGDQFALRLVGCL